MRIVLGLAFCLALSTTWGLETRVAEAQESSARERALRLFGEAAQDYRGGRFERAAARLREAYDLYAEPVLLYNLARALEGSGALREAQEAYRRYLSEAPPDADERQSAEARLAVIDGLVARLEPGEADPETSDAGAPTDAGPTTAEPRGAGGLVGGVTLTVLGGLGVGAGIGLGVYAVSLDDRARASSHLDAQPLHADAGTFATAANISFIAAGTIGLVGLTWTIIELSSGDGSGSSSETALRSAVHLRATPRLGGLELSGRF